LSRASTSYCFHRESVCSITPSFHINTITQPDTLPNQFSASELMFTLRFYEPFRNWRR
jgi:hypothetical protein